MLTVQPPLLSRPLLASDIGSLVHIDGYVAIVTGPASVSEAQPTLAAFDPSAKAFVHWLADSDNALIFGDKLILEVNTSEPIEQQSPDYGSGMKIFLGGAEMYAVLRMPNSRDDWRLFSLHSGLLASKNRTAMHVFSKWRLGVAAAGNEVAWLFHAD